MPLASGSILALVVLLVVAYIRQNFAALPTKLAFPLFYAISLAAAFVVRASTWRNEVVYSDKTLGQLNVASVFVVALILAAAAAGLDQGLKAVRNVGSPQFHDVGVNLDDAPAVSPLPMGAVTAAPFDPGDSDRGQGPGVSPGDAPYAAPS